MGIKNFIWAVEGHFAVTIPYTLTVSDICELEDIIGILFHIPFEECHVDDIERMRNGVNSLLDRHKQGLRT